jgi:hypothetical protein
MIISELPADVPKTDRELLLQIHMDVNYLRTKIIGNGGICQEIDGHEMRITALENWRWYLLGGVSILTFVAVLFGRYLDLGGTI